MDILRYKGCMLMVELNKETLLYHGKLLGLEAACENKLAVLEFDGSSLEALELPFYETVDSYLQCPLPVEELPKTYLGALSIRVSPTLHQQVAEQAAKQGISMNSWFIQVVEQALAAQ